MSDCISPYRTKAPEGGRFADLVQGPLPFFLTPATPALVARSQGGLTLGPEGGELGADFGRFGKM